MREVLFYANKTIPVKTVINSKSKKSFLTHTTRDLIKEKSKAYDNFKHSGSPNDLQPYKNLTKSVKKAIFNDRNTWLESELKPDTPDRLAWKKAREIIGQTENFSPTNININNEQITNPLRISNEFAKYHLKKLNELRKKATKDPKINPNERLEKWIRKKNLNIPTFQLKTINMRRLDALVNEIKPSKGLPSETIDGLTFKSIYPIIKEGILNIVNLSISSGTFEDNWKKQIIAPRHKRGPRDLLDNYRPVSTIVEIGKIVELEVHSQTVDHFTTNNLFNENHHGSVKNLDTTTALMKVNQFAINAAEEKKVTATVLLDQTAAFDIVDHETLINKLKLYKFSNNTLAWFTSYLKNRSFRVKVESKLSDPKELGEFGVPQGSVLGSLLFVISQNDLPGANDEDQDGLSTCFVDDETEQETSEDISELNSKIQKRVDNAVGWLKDNHMVISPDKTKLIISMTPKLRASRHQNMNFGINIDNQIILPTESEKLLGVIINQDITWSHHIWGESWREEKKSPV